MLRETMRKGIPTAAIGCLLVTLPLFIGCPPEVPWRSLLYPEDWEPAFTDAEGRFLHDFSYAGYHNGESEIPENPPGAVYDAVADYGADNTGTDDATVSIQLAIDDAGAAGGGIVLLPEGVYRCDGLLRITDSGVVLRGEGPDRTHLFFTAVTGMSGKAHITFDGAPQQGADLLLSVEGENRSTVVYLDDASSLQAGDDVNVGWVITEAFTAEHAMTGTWVSFTGQWKPFFRREVVALDLGSTPHEVTLDVPIRYPAKLRDGASLRRETGHLSECGLEALSLSNAVDWEAAWEEARVHVVLLSDAKDCWIRDVHSASSPYEPAAGYHLQNCGFRILSSKRITVADCRMENPQHRGGGGCGYLYEITKSNEVLIRDSAGIAGRHNFVQNWDFGTTGCVFLRCESDGGHCMNGPNDIIGYPCFSEYHHSLAMACLVDACTLGDGWYGGNRQDWSSGAGHTVTESVYWNTGGSGYMQSWQYGWGYVIGTQGLIVATAVSGQSAEGTEPQDWVEGLGSGDYLMPVSLYEDQLARRLNRQ